MCAAIFILEIFINVLVGSIMTIINTVAINLPRSLQFYKSLGFEYLSTEPGAYVYDRSVVIFISKFTKERLGLSLLQSDWSRELEAVREYVDPIVIEDGYLLSDSSGIHIKLLESSVQLPQSSVESILGNYSDISIEVVDFKRSKLIWGALGYVQTGGDEKQGWIVLSKDGNTSISLITAGSCPHIFTNPGLNYFNGSNNLEIIKKVRKSGVGIAEEITAFSKIGEVDNIILQDPAGLTFFLFND